MQDDSLPERGSNYQPHGAPQWPTGRPRSDESWKRGPELTALGRAVRELRACRAISQEGLGAAADTHRNYVGAVERGEMNPTFRVLLKLAHGLRIPLSELATAYERQYVAALGLTPVGHARADER